LVQQKWFEFNVEETALGLDKKNAAKGADTSYVEDAITTSASILESGLCIISEPNRSRRFSRFSKEETKFEA
jgi:hypothetical protein